MALIYELKWTFNFSGFLTCQLSDLRKSLSFDQFRIDRKSRKYSQGTLFIDIGKTVKDGFQNNIPE
jgi:hypothetical protein